MMLGVEWGGIEFVEKLNLMELVGIGIFIDFYLMNVMKFFWLVFIGCFSFFILFFIYGVFNGK